VFKTRLEFKDYVTEKYPGFEPFDSPLWSVEYNSYPSKYFVAITPVNTRSLREYWDWCNNNLKGQLLCYLSDSEELEEWWGFTEESDIIWWKLKWG